MTDPSYAIWFVKVYHTLQTEFGLDVSEVASHKQLQQYHADGETPEELMQRLETKYGLTRRKRR